ncbi:MAG: CDC48 family AAA ATPase [Myxococcota bacterium]
MSEAPEPRHPVQVQLPVAPAVPRDVGKGVVRLSARALERLGLRGGEVVGLRGKRTTAAVALPPRSEDEGLEIVRCDGLERHNASVSVRELLTISAATPQVARRVVLGPSQPNARLTGSGEGLRRTLRGRPLVPGNVISTSVFRGGERPPSLPPEVFEVLMRQRTYGLQEIRLNVQQTTPGGIVVVTEDTEVVLEPEYREPEEAERRLDVTYEDVGGIREVLDQIREMIELPLRHPELFQRLGIDPPKGVLLHGPPGTGKTLLARAVAAEADASFFLVNGPEIVGKHFGESEQRLRQIFEDARKEAPSIVFFDEIDSIAPKRDEATSEGERRLVAQLLTLMDGLEPRQNVVVIGATNRKDALDEALRRPGRFDRELTVGVPTVAGRREILQIHTRGMPLAEDVDLDGLARVTHGFVGADLGALAREAALETLRRQLAHVDGRGELPPELMEALVVRHDDFERALGRIQPTALREITIETPRVQWDDVGGLHDAKQSLREGVELPLRRPEAFRRLGIRPARGFLLYGPPGTGKTLLAKAVATESEANFLSVRSSDLLSKWYGESERQIARLFARARQVAPSVVFIDEVDSLAPRRGGGLAEPAVTERVVNALLAELDGLEERPGVVVLAATNQPTLLDPALLRPGRFDELVYVGVPDEAGRRRILGIHTAAMPLAPDVDLDALAARTRRYSGADLEDLVRRAGLLTLRAAGEAVPRDVSMGAFEDALAAAGPSVTEAMEKAYAAMAEELRQEPPRRRIGFAD